MKKEMCSQCVIWKENAVLDELGRDPIKCFCGVVNRNVYGNEVNNGMPSLEVEEDEKRN